MAGPASSGLGQRFLLSDKLNSSAEVCPGFREWCLICEGGGGGGGGGGCGLHVKGGVVSKDRNSVPHSVSSCPALR